MLSDYPSSKQNRYHRKYTVWSKQPLLTFPSPQCHWIYLNSVLLSSFDTIHLVDPLKGKQNRIHISIPSSPTCNVWTLFQMKLLIHFPFIYSKRRRNGTTAPYSHFTSFRLQLAPSSSSPALSRPYPYEDNCRVIAINVFLLLCFDAIVLSLYLHSIILYQVGAMGIPHFVSLTPWPHISRMCITVRITAERVIVNPGNHCRMNILQNPLMRQGGNKIGALFEGWRLVESSFICSEGVCEGIRDDDDTAEFQKDTSKQ